MSNNTNPNFTKSRYLKIIKISQLKNYGFVSLENLIIPLNF